MLTIDSLSLYTNTFNLNQITLHVQEGEFHIVMGPSGCGKTSLLECIVGLRKINSGRIFLNGRDITNAPTHTRNISYVPQDLSLFPHMNVLENILYSAKLNGEIDKIFIEEIIEQMELKKICEKSITKISGGEKKRVGLARALASKPSIILFDEPLSNLDTALSRELQMFIKKVLKEFKITSLFVTHDFDEAFFLGDIISVMIDGKLMQTSKKHELYFYPRNLKVANFLGIKNIFPAYYKEEREFEFLVFVPSLNTDIVVKKRPKFPIFKKDKELYIGLRSDEVMYIRTGRTIGFSENIIRGKIAKIFRRESLIKIIFETNNSLIEIDMPYGVLRKIGIKEGMDGEVMFKKEAIFIADFQ